MRTFKLPWLSCLAGAALLGACSPEDLPDTEQLDEVSIGSAREALNPPPNIALGKPTTQSSNYPGGGGAASLAVDGSINGSFGAGSVTHTNQQAQPWWQVDLQGSYPLSTVVLHNRTDCCSDRLQNFRVRVSEDGTNWHDYSFAGVAPTQSTFTINRSARYVRVQLNGTNALSLAEVQVFPSTINLARGKPATQSSNYLAVGGEANLAVDGSVNGDFWGAYSTTHTHFQTQPWWQVDLQGSHALSTVVLHNRTDCCADRLQNFRVRVSEDGANWHDYPFTGVAPTQSTFTINRSARYVRVQLDGTNALSLAEVQVFPAAIHPGNTVHGYWSASGGRSSSSQANRHFVVEVSGQNEWVTFNLTSPAADSYLYLTDANGNVLAEDDNSGGSPHARIARALSAGTYKLVAATTTAGQNAEFSLSADKALLRYPKRLRVQAATQFNWIYDDHDTGAHDDVSVWRADLTGYPGYYSLGDVAMPSHGVAPKMTFVVSGEEDLLARPVDYAWVWSDWGSGGSHDVSFWDPVPPAGYTCVGSVTVLGYDKPSTDLIRCVRSEYVLPAAANWLWNDSGSGSDNDIGVWQVDPRDHRGLSLSTFKGQGNYDGPDGRRFWTLNKSALANPEMAGLPVDGQTALQFAPRVWLHPEEYYLPSSVEHFLANVHEENGHLVTNQPLGCDSCTDPAFLDGVRPDQAHVPMYAEVVHRTVDGQPTNVSDIIYWNFYPYNNGKRVCIGWYSPWGCVGGYSTFGNHVGDWEHLTVRFIEGRPYAVYLSQHAGGQTLLFGDKSLAVLGWHPEAYAALGSHGLYPDAARHIYRNLPNGDFLADDTGRGIAWDGWVQPVVFPWKPMGTYTGSLDWLNITADWGNPPGGCDISQPVAGECVRNGGPTAPMKKSFSQPGHMPME
ncbi:Vps62-related protein [Pyxidicoccus fallax]|uniref:Vps62-related protein n=1 Tax=Pyxidicoccus fallax TaxID=394095 RepID=A0A848LX89_9BACT|nr:discoidin domain-containing protein [Pyxidicoccus fallax]NMO22241.1 Vps62-related protein [Pyxidicoccus fallax]NPC85204.1 Vps62-related protein [Pyxidicoccus fallax]